MDVTQWDLEDLTESETRFRNSGDMDRYARHLRKPLLAAFGLIAAGGGKVSFENDRYIMIVGNHWAPPENNSAMTVGIHIFVDRENDISPTLLAHEYIHVMQYAGNGGFVGDYDAETKRRGGDTGPGHRMESIAYLWGAWVDNFYWHGGLTHVLPPEIWKTPTRQQIADAMND